MKESLQDLFSTADGQCHPVYERIRKSGRVDVRMHLNALWQWYFDNGLADRHFLNEFPIRFTQRVWELETSWLLHNSGFSLSKTHAGSDFLCKTKNLAFEVEAIVAGPGAEDHPDHVKEIAFEGHKSIRIPERERTELLRLTNAIDVKAQKHQGDMQNGTSDPSLPFVIALSSVDMPTMVSGWDMPAALKAVYPIGGQSYEIDRNTGKFLRRRWQCRPEVHKNTPSRPEISTQVFCPGCGFPYHREVSALLYSRMNCQQSGYPYCPDEHRKQFVLIHNENATKPLPKGTIPTGTEYWLEQIGPYEYTLAESRIDEPEQDKGADG